jgi:Spy/CpxP family protein refolding chaperone
VKRNWLLYLVIFSLALNLGTLGAFLYLRYQDQTMVGLREFKPPLPMRELWRSLNLAEEQRRALRELVPEHRRRVVGLREDLARKRLELFELIKGEAPPQSAVQVKVREISGLQGGLEEEMVRFLLEFKKHLQPQQQAAMAELMQQRLCGALDCPPMGPHPPGRGGRMGRGPMEPKGPPPDGP